MRAKIFNLSVFLAVAAMIFYFYPQGEVIALSSRDKIKVVDGDSLESGKRRIRLLGIDAPEYKQYCFDESHKRYWCGISAKQFLERLIKQKDVNCVENSLDRYKRSLSTCYIGDMNINEKMVKSGWAVAYRDETNNYKRAEEYAKKHRLGIWKGKFIRPELYRFMQRKEK
ncbi:MAG: thermonuclease family protein [Alphaproteobacteria bacterium]|nr:thermonuclease family protein [Alphaproteobacteria bacterium]